MKTKNRPRPLLSIITRTYQRPDLLERCINSVLRQTLPDFEHLIIDDSIGHGLYWANRQIAECAEKTNGFYIYVLDDDDFITSYSFLEDLKDLLRDIAPREPDLIVCCGQVNGETFPKIWKQDFERGKIAAPNIITHHRLFERYACHWDQPRAGDFCFLEESCRKAAPDIFWWDYEVFCASSGCTLTQNEMAAYGLLN